mmetsp:Transcript_125525/g.217658  ORF Transcript_125525/g.217658 Transcript_125525/m.217658 type:complete len:167 (-) Transcript_125525:141-641(-)
MLSVWQEGGQPSSSPSPCSQPTQPAVFLLDPGQCVVVPFFKSSSGLIDIFTLAAAQSISTTPHAPEQVPMQSGQKSGVGGGRAEFLIPLSICTTEHRGLHQPIGATHTCNTHLWDPAVLARGASWTILSTFISSLPSATFWEGSIHFPTHLPTLALHPFALFCMSI